jgi:hypothetical protein
MNIDEINTEFDEKDLADSIVIPNFPIHQNKKIIFEATPKQQIYIDAVFSGMYRYLLFGGAIRGGKTYVVLSLLVLLCKIFPRSRWVVCRAEFPSIHRNVLPVFWKVCPAGFLEKYNQQTHTALFKNGSEIIFFSEQLSDDPELLRWHGLEFNGIVFEEADECAEKTFNKAVERVGSWIVSPMPPMLILLTCNPTSGWLRKKFYDPYVSGTLSAPYYFLQSLVSDNPHIAQEYVDKLKDMPPDLYKRFVEGSWDVEDSNNQLISWTSIHASERKLIFILEDYEKNIEKEKEQRAKELLIKLRDEQKKIHSGKYLGIDIGRFGSDASVWTIMEGPNFKEIIVQGKTSVDEVVEKTKRIIIENRIPCENVGADGVGIGGGVIDYLRKEKFPVHDIIGGASPEETVFESGMGMFSFFNLRSQMYWLLKHDLEKGLIGGLTSTILKDDLSAITYTIKGDKKIAIDSKDTIKEKIHRSTDYADSAMYANWMRRKDFVSSKAGFVFA